MKSIEQLLSRQPLASSLVMVFISVALLQLLKLFGGLSPAMLEWSLTLLRLIIAISFLVLLVKIGATKAALISTPYSQWGNRWFLSLLPISIIALINFLGVNFDALNYSISNVTLWLFSNIGIGLFEEILMRGAVFYILYKAWGTSNKGIYAAVLVQALIFGLVHYINIVDMTLVDVTFMVINATLIGVGFAGLMLVTRTIWLPVILHIVFDMIARMNELLLPGFEFSGESPIEQHIVSVIIVFLFVALPGLLYTRKFIQKSSL
jgi:membrane protease YdiL (CAAX protease family)